MTITCPHCGFSREVDPARLPARPTRVTCPRCRESFDFSPVAPAAEPAPAAAATPSPEELPKAGFWIRVLASVLDLMLVGVIESILSPLLFRLGGMSPLRSGVEGLAAISIATLFGLALGYAYRVFFIGYGGQTPGKMVVRIKVIRRDGGEVGYGTALMREVLGKFLSKILLGFGYLMVAFDRQKQGLHDRIADTYVIRL